MHPGLIAALIRQQKVGKPGSGGLMWGGQHFDDPYKLYNWEKNHGQTLSMDEFFNRYKAAGQRLGYQGRHPGIDPGMVAGQMPQQPGVDPGYMMNQPQMPPPQPGMPGQAVPPGMIRPGLPMHPQDIQPHLMQKQQMLMQMMAQMRRRRRGGGTGPQVPPGLIGGHYPPM